MGCGKSTLGKKLSQAVALPFIDLDQYIETQKGKSIAAIFQEEGEIAFRKFEYQAVLDLIQSPEPAIVSLGGGTPCYFDTMQHISDSSHTAVYLKTSIPSLVDRLFDERAKRPMISHLSDREALVEFIGKHLFERAPFYQQAKVHLTTDNKTVEELVLELKNDLA